MTEDFWLWKACNRTHFLFSEDEVSSSGILKRTSLLNLLRFVTKIVVFVEFYTTTVFTSSGIYTRSDTPAVCGTGSPVYSMCRDCHRNYRLHGARGGDSGQTEEQGDIMGAGISNSTQRAPDLLNAMDYNHMGNVTPWRIQTSEWGAFQDEGGFPR